VLHSPLISCSSDHADNDCNITILIFAGVEGFLPSLEPLMMKEVLITEGNGFRIVGKDVKTYGCSNFRIFNMKLVYCSCLFRLYEAANLRNKM
jgi:hypothetical protein